jgi:hypothetical protein
VYDFEVPELWSLAYAFPQLKRCTSKFGSIPEIWNWATMALALSPAQYRTDRAFLDRAAEWSLPKVHRIDQRVGAALGIRIEVRSPGGPNEVTQFYAPSTAKRSAGPPASPRGWCSMGKSTRPGCSCRRRTFHRSCIPNVSSRAAVCCGDVSSEKSRRVTGMVQPQ